ncbi:MAG: esterase [Polyangiaceae bacterium]|nr:esterase [Polyangiaceae bacterium]
MTGVGTRAAPRRARRGRGAKLRAVLTLAVAGVACESSPGAGVAQVASAGPRGNPPRASASASASPSAAASTGSGARAPAEERTWIWETSAVGRMHVVVSLPPRRVGERFPVLIAFHGRGEAQKGAARGARGWIDDYGLPRALQRLVAPPLTASDLMEVGDEELLSKLNADLRREPYRGLVVVTPYTPDILAGDRAFSRAEPLARFVVDELLPRVRSETPCLEGAARVGLDGVSLGGRAALLVGLARPESFGAVGTLQPAFDSADAPDLARRAQRARERNPTLSLRLLTSRADFFLLSTRAISSAFTALGVHHELRVVPGPHDYEFNRGPGVYEMLLFHDRALRRAAR